MRLALVLAAALVLGGCAWKQRPTAAPAGTPPPVTPAWGEVPHDQRSQDKKAIDGATHGSP